MGNMQVQKFRLYDTFRVPKYHGRGFKEGSFRRNLLSLRDSDALKKNFMHLQLIS